MATSPPRRALLEQLAAEVDALPAVALRDRGRTVVHASIDSFHQPRAVRHARGAHDPEGFYRDSYDLAAFARELLDPFAPSGDGAHRAHVFDAATDAPDVAEQQRAAPGTILVVDGIFLHRPELAGRWTWSLWLHAQPATTVARCAVRDASGSPDPNDASNRRYVEGQRRYVEGQRLYVQEAAPHHQASHVVDNDDLDHPLLLR